MNYNIDPHITGNTWDGLNFTFSVNGSALNLSDTYIEFEVKSFHNLASPVVLSLTTKNSGILIINPLFGGILIPEQVVSIPVGKYAWSLTLSSRNEIKTYLDGVWQIVPKNSLVSY